MQRTILVCGHGPGISDAVARRFGREGFSVGIIARNAERLSQAAERLATSGVTARAFPGDLGDPAAVPGLVREAAAALGPIAAIHWNAYAGGAGDLLTASASELEGGIRVSVTGLVMAVQAALHDLKAQRGSVLVTGGAFALYDPAAVAAAVQYEAMGLAIAKAAQHKTTELLHAALAPSGVYVGEVVIAGVVKGTAFDAGHGTLEPDAIAERFWALHQQREEASVLLRG